MHAADILAGVRGVPVAPACRDHQAFHAGLGMRGLLPDEAASRSGRKAIHWRWPWAGTVENRSFYGHACRPVTLLDSSTASCVADDLRDPGDHHQSVVPGGFARPGDPGGAARPPFRRR
jgi:hypothetical protein